MAVSSVNNQNPLQQFVNDAAKSSKRNTGEMGKNEFLNLLVTQLRYQDPLNPVDDKEFIAQMAQFSSLEQMQNMNTSFTSVKAFSLIGKYVAGTMKDGTTGEVKAIEGTVSSVKMSNGKSYVVVNGNDVEVDSITDVREGSGTNTTNLAAYTNLIGYNAKGHVYDSSTGDIIAVSGKVTSVEKGQYEDYAVMDDVEVEISAVIDGSVVYDKELIKSYLENHKIAAKPEDKMVSVVVYDAKNNKKVPVKASLEDFTVDETSGKITVKLDQVYVPVDSVFSIKP